MSRPDWDEWGLALAATVSTRADCTRRQVGAVVMDANHRILATGYNGAPSGDLGCATDGACPRGQLSYEQVREFTDYESGPGRCVSAHAEVNALLHSGRDSRGATLYVTDSPCPACSKVIRAAGIARVVTPTVKVEK